MVTLCAGAFVACSSADDVESELDDQQGDPGAGLPATGGAATTSGGSSSDEAGGTPGSGGQSATGGATATGGSLSTGGVPTTGGATATGGSLSTGGVPTTGGAPATGGVPTTGGAAATGGVPATGGEPSTGECTNVRPTGTDWDSATCDQWANSTSECSQAWMIDGNYCNESCGRCDGSGTGGSDQGTGGSDPGTGGSPPVSTCNEGDAQVCSTYQTGQHCGLTYEIWTDGSSGCMTNTSYGFQASWDQGNANYLARKGVRPGSAEPVVTYSADYNPNGNSYLGIYGWTQNPLIEYYIIDSWGSWKPPGTEVIGTLTSDGGNYEIYRSQRVNKPSIEGNTTFWQYWSVRTEKRTSGTITVANHFDAWAQFGLTMGSFYEVSLVVEGYNSSGQADVTVSFQ